ncbi:transcription termination factor 5, mitochondrial [Toxorhynchites rutilus septentrionalis]|uniref:transcription termination factor 5, mitochondrial n=1 Tax=Toxorhynchites rutilus septentrionalis TaxID=329112 RepID=UPI002479813D|nr:transcription termination factor 5, mitochondrial [Toxorhynchites rutilus septentrionalis]
MYRYRYFLDKQRHLRYFCAEKKFKNLNQAAKFYSPLLGVKESTMYQHLTKHQFLAELDPAGVRKKVEYLRYLNAKNEEIIQHPGVLYPHLITLENRTEILRECGFVESLNIVTLSKYVKLVKQRIKTLKMNHLIPLDLDMIAQLTNQFDPKVSPRIEHNDEILLQDLREKFLNEFLRKRLDLTEAEFKKLWKSYANVKHKSFGHTQRVIDILQYDYKFERDKIVSNLYLLYADPENLLRYPKVVPSIAGMDIADVMLRQPKILMVQCDNVKEVLDLLSKNKIDHAGILKYSTILTLSPSTVSTRLEELRKVREFDILFEHPKILKLIAYQRKAAIRLDFLQQMKFRCASLNVLTSHSECFEKYVRDGYDRIKGKDTAHYLGMVFKNRESEAFKHLKRHPNWFHVPIVQMQEVLQHVLDHGFDLEDIYDNVQILLYPLSRVDRKLDKLLESKNLGKPHEHLGIELTATTPSQILSLCLYMIELDFHFTGDGVWPEQIQQSDSATSTRIELPKNLNKEYKYGKHPATSASSEKMKIVYNNT